MTTHVPPHGLQADSLDGDTSLARPAKKSWFWRITIPVVLVAAGLSFASYNWLMSDSVSDATQQVATAPADATPAVRIAQAGGLSSNSEDTILGKLGTEQAKRFNQVLEPRDQQITKLWGSANTMSASITALQGTTSKLQTDHNALNAKVNTLGGQFDAFGKRLGVVEDWTKNFDQNLKKAPSFDQVSQRVDRLERVLAQFNPVGSAQAAPARQNVSAMKWSDHSVDERVAIATSVFESKCGSVPPQFAGELAQKAVVAIKSMDHLEREVGAYCEKQQARADVEANTALRQVFASAPQQPRPVYASNVGAQAPVQVSGPAPQQQGGDQVPNFGQIRAYLDQYQGPLMEPVGQELSRHFNKAPPEHAKPCKPPGYDRVVLCAMRGSRNAPPSVN